MVLRHRYLTKSSEGHIPINSSKHPCLDRIRTKEWLSLNLHGLTVTNSVTDYRLHHVAKILSYGVDWVR